MGERLLELAKRRAAALFLLTALLAVAGIWQSLSMPAAIFPNVTFPRVKVIADAGEQPAIEMIPRVTRPLEEAILRVPGVRRVTSLSARGSTEIGAEFAWGTDMQTALARVQAQIERVRPDLPPDTRVEAEWMNTAIFPILGYALVGDSSQQASLKAIAEYRIKPELLRIPGVSQVQVQGGRDREFRIRLDAGALAGRGLAASDVAAAIQADDRVESAGLVEANHELYLSLVDGRAQGADDLRAIAVPVGTGVPATIGQLGTVEPADAVSFVRTTAGDTAGGGPAVLINVIRHPDANTLQIASAVDAVFAKNPGLIPAGARWIPFYDQAELVREAVHGVRDAILIGVLLAGVVIFGFLKRWRETAIAVAAIPVTVAIVLLVLSAAGQTIDLMTMGGIAAAIGLIADDAIVVVEALDRRPTLAPFLPPLAGSSLATIVIFLPFALLSGVAGAFFRPLALTMGVALTVSFLLSALVIPSLAGAPRDHGDSADADSKLGRALRLTYGHPWLATLAVAACLGAALVMYRSIGTDFLPEMDEGSIIMDYWTPPGTSLTDTDATLREVEKILGSLPDVRSWSRRTGTQLGFYVTEPNTGDYVIRLKPAATRRASDDVIDDLRGRIASAEPALRTDFGQLLEDDIGDLAGGAPQPIDLKLYGDDAALLEKKARLAADTLRGMKGYEDVFDGITIAGPALDVRVDPLAAARWGLTTEAVHDAIEPALFGSVAGDLRIGERLYGIRLVTPTVSQADLANLKLRGAGGALVPLSAVAKVATGEPEAEIDRENLKTFLAVTARLSAGVDLGSAVDAARRRVGATLRLPEGMSMEFGGQYEQQQASFKGLFAVLLAGLALVAVVMLFEFGDWRMALVVVMIAPASLVGVFGLLEVTGQTFNVSSFVGAIMMVGIVGEKAVFLIQEARERLAGGAEPARAWSEAALRRVRPALMTTIATVVALLPLALGRGEGAQLQRPLAIAVIGGFLFSGTLVVWVLPAIAIALDPRGAIARR